MSGAAEPTVADYVLGLADDAYIYSHRLAQWITNAPTLEEDIALANISLDLLGQARGLYPHVGELDGSGASEDDFAMFRGAQGFRNVWLVELERGDFAQEMLRLLIFSSWRLSIAEAATASTDKQLAAVMAKGVKEVRYHLEHAHSWVVRLGDGTDESHRRMVAATAVLWPYLDELFVDDPASIAAAAAGVGPLPSSLREAVMSRVTLALTEAGIGVPDIGPWRAAGGRAGRHTDVLSYALAEMQSVARAHPGASW